MTGATVSVLFSSAGRRVGLVNCFRRAAAHLGIGLEVLACDIDPDMSAACNVADRSFRVPPCRDAQYVPALRSICETHRVSLVVPTIDPELGPLAEASADFASLATRLHVSSANVVAIAGDKLRTAELLRERGVPVPRTATLETVRRRPEDWSFPLLLKPRGGSASIGLRLVQKPEEIPGATGEPFIAQEFLEGPEYTVNFFVDGKGSLRCAVPHRRIRVRAGEVEKGRTERQLDCMAIAHRIAEALPGARGAMCFQVILDPRLGPKVIEINARFGGGYPLADRAGGFFARWLLEEVTGLPSSMGDDWREGVTMLRYDEAVYLE